MSPAQGVDNFGMRAVEGADWRHGVIENPAVAFDRGAAACIVCDVDRAGIQGSLGP